MSPVVQAAFDAFKAAMLAERDAERKYDVARKAFALADAACGRAREEHDEADMLMRRRRKEFEAALDEESLK